MALSSLLAPPPRQRRLADWAALAPVVFHSQCGARVGKISIFTNGIPFFKQNLAFCVTYFRPLGTLGGFVSGWGRMHGHFNVTYLLILLYEIPPLTHSLLKEKVNRTSIMKRF